ncbi:MAG TPA: helix-turn-helix domain-containing protein [Bacteroidales bacterium]|jgi:AraC-like DNA-binding protein|nr:helix-turn-helix domain-containing protein [Bacteroidales bacterium]
MIPDAKYYTPGDDISWLVKQFESIRYNSRWRLTDKFVPREDAALVFHFGDRPRMMSPVNQQLPRFFIAPLVPTAYSIMLKGLTDSLIAICKPTILSRILKISMIPGSKVYIPLSGTAFSRAWEMMNKYDDPEGRIKAFTKFILKLHPQVYTPDETDEMYEKILGSNFHTPLREVIGEFKVSERTVQRRFRERLGITPKMLSRIVKINTLWNSISTKETIDYHDIVFFGNYFDQAHFIKDFKAITGETPDFFFRRNLSVTKIMSGRGN